MINTDEIPANPSTEKTYVVKGKTFAAICKKARQKLVFSRQDFTVKEDDNRLLVSLRGGRNNPYLLGDDEAWDINAQPEGYDGVRYDGFKNENVSGVVYFYSRTIIVDGSGRTIYVGPFAELGFPAQGYS